MLPRTNIPQPGDIIGEQFRLERTIGRGSFGIVFAARQLGLERQVAIKMLHPRSVANDTVVERFKREAQLASSLTNPNAVVIHAVGVHQGKTLKLPFIAMEYLQGRDLQSHMVRNGVMELAEATAVLLQSLDCLAEAHRKGIIHRDLKPENVFICDQGPDSTLVKIVDFGIAKAVTGDWSDSVEASLTKTGMVCGTPQFMPPEQATGQRNLTTAVDVYAMACIMYEMLSGEPPFSGTSPMDVAIKHLKSPIPPLPDPYPETFIAPILTRALAKKPLERYQTAAEMAVAVRQGAEQAGIVPDLSLGLVVKTDDELARISAHSLQPVDPLDEDYAPPLMTRVEHPSWSDAPAPQSEDTLSVDVPEGAFDEAEPYDEGQVLSRTILVAIAAGAVLLSLVLATLLLVLVLLDGGDREVLPAEESATAVSVGDDDPNPEEAEGDGSEADEGDDEGEGEGEGGPDAGSEAPAIEPTTDLTAKKPAGDTSKPTPKATNKRRPVRGQPRKPRNGKKKPNIPIWTN